MKHILPNTIILIFTMANFIQAQPFRGCATGSERVPAVNATFEKEILRLVNLERKKRGIAPLTWNRQMAWAARYHAADMAHDDYFGHTSQDPENKSLCGAFVRMRKFGRGDAENIAAGGLSPKATMEQWMHSPGHKKNILNPSFKSMGVGYYYKAGLKNDWGHYWVQNFSWNFDPTLGGDKTKNRSYKSKVKAILEVKNLTKKMLRGYWVDYQGKQQKQFYLRPGQTHKQTTSTRHLWLIKDAEWRLYRKIKVTQKYQLVVVEDK